jgi:short-subunit dehydrogenase
MSASMRGLRSRLVSGVRTRPARSGSGSGSGGASSGVDLAAATALVTGATGGLGRAIAQALADRGARLVLSGRRATELGSVASLLGAQTILADLAVAEDVSRLCEEAVAAGVDVLVANAALPASGRLTELSEAEIDRMLDVNLRVPIMLAHALGPAMSARGRGHLVFVSSLSGRAASPASSMYSATKFGLRGFALALRQDLQPRGVGVSLVSPGFIRDAGMYAEAGVRLPPGTGTKAPADVGAAVIRAIETGRAELDVASMPLRLGATIASVAPQLAASASRLAGADRISTEFAERQRDKR